MAVSIINTLETLIREPAHMVEAPTVMIRSKFHVPSTIRIPLSGTAEADGRNYESQEVIYCLIGLEGEKTHKVKGHTA